jgi:hypothetical protein
MNQILKPGVEINVGDLNALALYSLGGATFGTLTHNRFKGILPARCENQFFQEIFSNF